MQNRRTPSSTIALGTASAFIFVAIAVGFLTDRTARTPATSQWELRGTVSPEGAMTRTWPSLA